MHALHAAATRTGRTRRLANLVVTAALTLGGLVATAPAAVAAVPGAPAWSSVTSVGATVSLDWTSVTALPEVTGYRVQVATGEDSPDSYAVVPDGNAGTCRGVELAASTNSVCTYVGVAGTRYWFKVAAINTDGTGSYSSVVSIKAGRPTAPGTPSLEPGDATLSVAWSVPSDTGGSPITGYNVQVAPSSAPSGTWYQVVSGTCEQTRMASTTTRSCTITAYLAATATSLANGTPYRVQVAALNESGVGLYSSSSASTPRTVPSAPTAVQGTPGSSQATVTWLPPESNGGAAVSDYRVSVSSSATGQFTAVVFGTCATSQSARIARSCTVTGLTNGLPYYFKVAATNDDVTFGNLSNASDVVVPRTASNAPTLATPSQADGRLTLSWTAPTDTGGASVVGYDVQVSNTSSISGFAAPAAGTCIPGLANTSTTLTCTITGLANGTTYYVKVAARTAAGIGTYSDVKTGIPSRPAAAPTRLIVVPGKTTTTVSWTAPTDTGGYAVTGYVVQIGVDNGTWGDVLAGTCTTAPTSPTTLSCTITGLLPGTGYYVRVAARTAAGTGTFTAASARFVPATPKVLAVTGTAVLKQVDIRAGTARAGKRAVILVRPKGRVAFSAVGAVSLSDAGVGRVWLPIPRGARVRLVVDGRTVSEIVFR